MLATGGSACAAIDVIKAQGVPEENIIFVNVLSSCHGAKTLFSRFPHIRLVTAAVDEDMTPSK
jgi:uracil phosphoribosyltransferase